MIEKWRYDELKSLGSSEVKKLNNEIGKIVNEVENEVRDIIMGRLLRRIAEDPDKFRLVADRYWRNDYSVRIESPIVDEFIEEYNDVLDSIRHVTDTTREKINEEFKRWLLHITSDDITEFKIDSMKIISELTDGLNDILKRVRE